MLVAGLSGGVGKTIVTLGLLLMLRRAGLDVRAFKKGPDYIDPEWLEWASAHPARNLDAFLMGADVVCASFARHAVAAGVNVIEGNRGLFDGLDAQGTYSSASLAEILGAPVVLVIDATKMTRTAAAMVLGCQKLDPRISIQAVVLNHVNGQRHERILREAIESACSVPVVGALPRLGENPLPERHLGLVPPDEHQTMNGVARKLLAWMEGHLDLDTLLAIARSAPPLAAPAAMQPPLPDGRGLRIGYLRDSAFTFYYPENLEELERAGAQLVSISPLLATALPQGLDALYIGGGFPETHAETLAANTGFLASLREACAARLPVYAECGGLMLLARRLTWRGAGYAMANVFPIDVEAFAAPQGHGYSELRVDTPNAYFPLGAALRGHEFHYSRIVNRDETVVAACAVLRGTGCFDRRDGLVTQNVMAAYTHLHAAATPEWASGFLAAARQFKLRTSNRKAASSVSL